jgi:hypothetical protein
VFKLSVNLPDPDQAVRVRDHLRRLHDDPGAAAVVPLAPARQPHLPGAVSGLHLPRRRRLHLPRYYPAIPLTVDSSMPRSASSSSCENNG